MISLNAIESMLDHYIDDKTSYADPANTYGTVPENLSSGVAAFNTHDGLNFLLATWKNRMLKLGHLRPVEKEDAPDSLFLPHSSLHYDTAKWGYLVVQEAANRNLTRGYHTAVTDTVGDSSNSFFLGKAHKANCIIRTFSEGSVIKVVLFEWHNAQGNHVEGISIKDLLENPNCITWRVAISD